MLNRWLFVCLKFLLGASKKSLRNLLSVVCSYRQSWINDGYWYKIVVPYAKISANYCLQDLKKPTSYHFKKKLFLKEYVVYDFDIAIHQMKADGIALVFFMGLGDYVMATPAIHEIRKKTKGVPLHAYVSDSLDIHNSPLVADLLRKNPNIDQVFTYRGKDHFLWKHYDYTDVFNLVPKNFIVAPVLYPFNAQVRHRNHALFETFSLPRPTKWLLPLLDLPEKNNENVLSFLNRIKNAFIQSKSIGVIFLQLDTRSNQYSYPDTDQLIESLCEKGYLIVSVSKNNSKHPACMTLDISNFPIWDSICLLKSMKTQFQDKLFLVAVSSVFWSVSAAFQIPALGIHHFCSKDMHNYWYPNIFVIAPTENPVIPYDKIFLANVSDYILNPRGQCDFLPSYISQCFLEFIEKIKENPVLLKCS